MKSSSAISKFFAVGILALVICSTFAAFKTRIDAFLLDGTYTLERKNGEMRFIDRGNDQWKIIARSIFSNSAFQRLAQDLGKSEFEIDDHSNERYVYLGVDGTRLFIDVRPQINGIAPSGDFPLRYSWNSGEFIDYFEN